MSWEFSGEIWRWQGPAPWYFITVPEEESLDLHETATSSSYGWGMIPVTVRSGASEWATSLFPKDGGYLVPIRAAIRRTESLDAGDPVTIELLIDV